MHLVCELIPDVHLLIAGKGRDKDRLEHLINELGLRKNITLCGFISEEDKASFYAAGDIFALHTLFEGLGIVILEASATGLPIITTDAGGTRDVVIQGETGYLLPIGDAPAFANQIISTLSDTKRLQEMGQAAREFAVREFDEYVIAERYLNLFEQVVQDTSVQI
jgi:glycosyltransferase involved in cell wall biosynthesis